VVPQPFPEIADEVAALNRKIPFPKDDDSPSEDDKARDKTVREKKTKRRKEVEDRRADMIASQEAAREKRQPDKPLRPVQLLLPEKHGATISDYNKLMFGKDPQYGSRVDSVAKILMSYWFSVCHPSRWANLLDGRIREESGKTRMAIRRALKNFHNEFWRLLGPEAKKEVERAWEQLQTDLQKIKDGIPAEEGQEPIMGYPKVSEIFSGGKEIGQRAKGWQAQ